jgi:hypothetical protein
MAISDGQELRKRESWGTVNKPWSGLRETLSTSKPEVDEWYHLLEVNDLSTPESEKF